MKFKGTRTLLFYIFLSIASLSMGQESIRIKKGFRSLRQQALFIECTVLDEPKIQKHEFANDHYYYWFQSQRIMCTQGGASGQLLHGGYEAFYDSKQLAEKGKFHKGLKQGVWKYWNSSGHLERIEHWSRGEYTGKQLYFNGKGLITCSLNYKHSRIVRSSSDSIVIYNLSFVPQKIKVLNQAGKWEKVAITKKTEQDKKSLKFKEKISRLWRNSRHNTKNEETAEP